MLAPVADRPPAGTPGVTLALLNLIGREFKEAAELAHEYGYVPIRGVPSAHPDDRRAFYGLHDVRLCLNCEGRVEEVLVPRPLTAEESAYAGANIRLLNHLLKEMVYARRHDDYWEEVLVQVMTDLYLLSFPLYCPTKGAITTFIYHRLRHNSKRVTRIASIRLATERHVTPVGLAILQELEGIPAREHAPPLLPNPERAAALVRELSPNESERNVKIIVRRFGLAGPIETLDQLAEAFAITRQRVQQIASRFLTKCERTPAQAEILRSSL